MNTIIFCDSKKKKKIDCLYFLRKTESLYYFILHYYLHLTNIYSQHIIITINTETVIVNQFRTTKNKYFS